MPCAARKGRPWSVVSCTVVFAWAEWPSKQVRDEADAKLRDDPRAQPTDLPFDGKRMIFGGFEVLHESS